MPMDYHKRFDSCPAHGLRKRFDLSNLVLWFCGAMVSGVALVLVC